MAMEVKNHKNLTDEIWLNYFNDVLYEKGIITETERNKMKNLISNASNTSIKKKKSPLYDR